MRSGPPAAGSTATDGSAIGNHRSSAAERRAKQWQRVPQIAIVRGVESLDAAGVTLADGGQINPDAMVCATGFRRGLAKLVGHLGVLDERGWPKTTGEKPAADGLRFIGFVPRPSQIGFAAKQAQRAAKAIARELRNSSKQSSE